jgi:hypothetical protein
MLMVFGTDNFHHTAFENTHTPHQLQADKFGNTNPSPSAASQWILIILLGISAAFYYVYLSSVLPFGKKVDCSR